MQARRLVSARNTGKARAHVQSALVYTWLPGYTYVHDSKHIHAHAPTHPRTHAPTHIHTQAPTHKHPHKSTHKHTYTCTNTRPYTHIQIHTHAHAHAFTFMHAQAHKYPYTHAYAFTYMHGQAHAGIGARTHRRIHVHATHTLACTSRLTTTTPPRRARGITPSCSADSRGCYCAIK